MPLSYFRRPLFLLLVVYLGVLCVLRVNGVIEKPPWHYVAPELADERPLSGLRRAVLDSYDATLAPERAAVLSGVVMGERAHIPPDLTNAFRRSGAMHLLVASGSNVAFAMLLAAGLARALGFSRSRSLVAGALGALLYTATAGADPPLVRGFLMAAASLAGFFLGRNSGAFQGLVLSAWLLSLWDPQVVFTAGFQMSFAACFGLVAASRAWRPPQRWPPAARYAAGVFLASLAAQLAIAPVIAAHFRQVSLAALFSNVLLVPMSGGLMYGGFALAAAWALHPGLGVVVAAAVSVSLVAFEGVVRFFASWDLFWRVPAPHPALLFLYYGALLRLWCRPKKGYNAPVEERPPAVQP